MIHREWSAASATGAYYDTLKLCGHYTPPCDTLTTPELGNTEFISALAAGMSAKLMVEVASGASPTTIALAAAARHTGGRLVCILPEPVLVESKRVIQDSGLTDMVEFETGNPSELLPNYKNIDFSLVDCKKDGGTELLKLLDVNPRRSVVITNNLVGEKKGLGGRVRGLTDKAAVTSLTHPIGEGMEVTMLTERDGIEKRDRGKGRNQKTENCSRKRTSKKHKWLVKVDEKSGEEHIFMMPGHKN